MVKIKKTKSHRKHINKPERERKRRDKKFKVDINTTFTNADFCQVPTRGKDFDLNGRTIEIDNVFIYENILIISEDTTDKNPQEHLIKKAQVFAYILSNKRFFVNWLKTTFRTPTKSLNQYSVNDLVFKFLYCSYNKLDRRYKTRHSDIYYMDYNHLQYFLRLSKIIKKSVRFELFKLLDIKLLDIGAHPAGSHDITYDGFLLPESPSGFPEGYKIVSFLVEPERLLEQSYVLRKDGWHDTDYLYQRLLMLNKIMKMREYLQSQKRVFVNNIIVSLPPETKILDMDGAQINATEITRTQPVKIQIPKELNNIGIIDGQHRIFSYHESSDKYERVIKELRTKQHLLLTGVIYPEEVSDNDRTKFEAQLFLEINDKQTRAKADLKQTIELILKPFSDIAIAKSVLNNLANTGPLVDCFEVYFYETKKIKTSSIVSYGLRHLVRLDSSDSFISIYPSRKKVLQHKKSELDKYINFCTNHINVFISGFKARVGDMWTTDKKVSRVLTTTTINGLIFCLRKLVQNGKLGDYAFYEKKFHNLKINFKPEHFKYKSSHWKDLGDKIYNDCFE